MSLKSTKPGESVGLLELSFSSLFALVLLALTLLGGIFKKSRCESCGKMVPSTLCVDFFESKICPDCYFRVVVEG